ncbi:MAG: hypothetical protein IJW99_12340, partial [Clostridia bacterium]|nr:hypothetical protein [Clostridia bacterium]
ITFGLSSPFLKFFQFFCLFMVYWLFIHGFVTIQPRGLLRKPKDAKKPKNNAAAMPRMQGKRPLPHERKRAMQTETRLT